MLFRELVAAKRRTLDDYDRDVTLAWNISNLHPYRVKKLPDLRMLLSGRRKVKQTVGQQRASLVMLSEQYGIPLRKAGKRKKR